MEAQIQDRQPNLPTHTPTSHAVTRTEQHIASNQPLPRPCKRRCLNPYLLPVLAHPTIEINVVSGVKVATESGIGAEAGAEAGLRAGARAGIEAEARAEAGAGAGAAEVPHLLTAENLAALPNSSSYLHPSPPSDPSSTVSTSDFPQGPDCTLTNTSVEITISETRTLLKRNRLHIFDHDAQERAHKIIQAGQEIRERRRASTMQLKSSEALVKTIQKYANKGERTLMFHLWKALLNDTRRVPSQVPDRELTREDDPDLFQWVERAWDKDNIWGKWEADFAADSCPTLELTDDPKLNAVLLDVLRILAPRPDIAYSFDFDAFDEIHREILHHTTRGRITGQQFCTFFAVEAKCGEHSIEEAENQCCRTGATMAKSRRDMARILIDQKTLLKTLRASIMSTLSQSIDPVAQTSGHVPPAQAPPSNISAVHPSTASNYPTQDMETTSFTLAVCPQIAKMCIHFVETWPDGHTEWQMHRLKSYLLEDCVGLQELHHDIDNILDWGCTKRKKEISDQADELAQTSLEIQEAKKAKSTYSPR